MSSSRFKLSGSSSTTSIFQSEIFNCDISTTSYLKALRQRQRERAATPRLGLDCNRTAHHLDQILDNGQAQTSALVLARGAFIHLPKFLEDKVDCFWRYPDPGIPDSDLPDHGIRRTDVDRNTTCLGELYGIPDQVGQHLLHFSHVA